MEDVEPGHIKGSARSLVPHLRETLSMMVHFTRGCSTSVTMMRVSCVEIKCNMWPTEKQESDACRTFFFLLFPCAGLASGSDSERCSAGVASHFFSHALCIVGGSEVEKWSGAAVWRDQGKKNTTLFAAPKAGRFSKSALNYRLQGKASFINHRAFTGNQRS